MLFRAFAPSSFAAFLTLLHHCLGSELINMTFVGCMMAIWQAKNMGVVFGGIADEDTSEERLESVLHNDM